MLKSVEEKKNGFEKFSELRGSPWKSPVLGCVMVNLCPHVVH